MLPGGQLRQLLKNSLAYFLMNKRRLRSLTPFVALNPATIKSSEPKDAENKRPCSPRIDLAPLFLLKLIRYGKSSRRICHYRSRRYRHQTLAAFPEGSTETISQYLWRSVVHSDSLPPGSKNRPPKAGLYRRSRRLQCLSETESTGISPRKFHGRARKERHDCRLWLHRHLHQTVKPGRSSPHHCRR